MAALLLLIIALIATTYVHSFTPPLSSLVRTNNIRIPQLRLYKSSSSEEYTSVSVSRHRFLATTAASLIPILTNPSPSYALVKGNAPPPKKGGSEGKCFGVSILFCSYHVSSLILTICRIYTALKCRNVEECQEQAEKAEQLRAQQEAERAASGPKAQVAGSTKYLDIEIGSSDNGNKIAKTGSNVDISYKVLKLGKRSYDGLSGEGTVVFSRGYALEDDEKVPGDKLFKFQIGDNQVIKALNEAVAGMSVGGTRRISITPQNGWEKNTRACDGGPGGQGTGGELKTDYVVVPTATMVEQEACFDKAKLPFPTTYAQERRMAQRFDQSLIIEVQLMNVS